MADGRPSDEGAPVGERLARVVMFLEAAAAEVARRFEAVQAGAGGPPTEAARELAELRKWAALAYEEQAKIETLIQKEKGGGAGAIDFAEARAQIGRRLDRLRAAERAGSVPE